MKQNFSQQTVTPKCNQNQSEERELSVERDFEQFTPKIIAFLI